MRSLPESCKLAVLVNPSPYLAEGPDPMNDAKLNTLLARLTKAGVAVAIFETAAKPSTTAKCLRDQSPRTDPAEVRPGSAR